MPEVNLDSFSIKEVTWDEVSELVKNINLDLFNCIKKIKLKKKPNLIKAVYPFGSKIVSNGALHFYHQSKKTIPIHSEFINNDFKKKLSYSSIPLALLLNKAVEIFSPFDQKRVIPLKLLMPGQLFGLQELMQTFHGNTGKSISCINSGARSIFLIPKIANKGGYYRLKKHLNIQLDPPISLSDHWDIFTLISNHSNYINSWNNHILFFTGDWFEKANYNNPDWFSFFNFLSQNYCKQLSPEFINYYNFELAWQEFMTAISCRNLKPRPYILSTAKHLLAIAANILPGFCPSDLKQITAPTKIIKDIYIEIYKLKNYLPTIMHPSHFELQTNKPLYYSLSFPSILEGLPSNKEPRDILTDERELKILFDTIKNISNPNKNRFSRIHGLVTKVQYDFYHNNTDAHQEIYAAFEITKEGSDLLDDKSLFPNRNFCYTSTFLNGCIKISKKP